MKKLVFICFIFILLSGCASILGSSNETVVINSDVNDVFVTVKDRTQRTILHTQAPTVVSLRKKYGYFKSQEYVVTAEKEGYIPQVQTLSTDVSGWYWGNILLGGLIGMLIVDPLTGAMWTFEEDTLYIHMEKK